jgi:hypothetical protein
LCRVVGFRLGVRRVMPLALTTNKIWVEKGLLFIEFNSLYKLYIIYFIIIIYVDLRYNMAFDVRMELIAGLCGCGGLVRHSFGAQGAR